MNTSEHYESLTDDALSIRPNAPRQSQLIDLIAAFDLEVASGDVAAAGLLTGTTLNSRDVRQGDLYAALPGAKRHGAEFAAQAVASGASAILTDRAGAQQLLAAEVTIPVVVSASDPREILGEVSAWVYGTQSTGARIFGVTGTNGKTSVVYLLEALLRAVGETTALSSTAERRIGDTVLVSALTSPEAPELHGLLARMRESQVTGVALEVSAHAVERHRIDGVRFDVVAFNNFSQDHLDDFGDMEQYFAAKQALFAPEHAERGVVVVDSPEGRRIVAESKIPVTTLATEYGSSADWHLAVTRQTIDGVSFVLQGPAGAQFRGSVPLFGRFMAENAALALIMLHEAGISVDQVAAALSDGKISVYIPGRIELINPDSAGPRFYVDYGHTPGAFEVMLEALGEVAPGRVIFMFGADGDRDTTKRFAMGKAAAAASDELIICDYHPRTEDPADIRAQLIAGATAAAHANIHEIADPRAAIRAAISLAQPGDVILYAGPGHEDYQEIAGEHVPYSAREEVRGALREAGMLK